MTIARRILDLLRPEPDVDELDVVIHVTTVRTLVTLAASSYPDGLEQLDALERWLGISGIDVPEDYVRRPMPGRSYASLLLDLEHRIRAFDRDPRLALAAMGVRLAGDPGPAQYGHAARNALAELDLVLVEAIGDSYTRTRQAAEIRAPRPVV